MTTSLSLCVLASGSKGNAIYVSDGHSEILFDAGLSGVQIERRMQSKNLNPDRLRAIVVSHEHADHISGVGVLSRRYKLPVYISPKTLESAAGAIGKMHEVVPFECGRSFRIDDLLIHPFPISHDAEDPAGFTVQQNGSKIGIATDLGIASAVVKQHLSGCRLLVLEANHDEQMLAEGSYPWPLKQRIRSRNGHLSNAETENLLQEIVHDHLRHVILAHLSAENNSPEKALQQIARSIGNSGIHVTVASQDSCSDLLRV